jgi:F-type H+-transporting ATPase subunit a
LKGVWIFIGILVAAALFCWLVPFVILPNAGLAMALPVITVPGEKLCTDCLGISGLTLTNTLMGTLLADLLVLLFAFGATRRLKEVPGRFQGLFEMLTDALYSLAKSTAGSNARKVFPLMATIFLFLLFANWLELVPAVDSVGLMHCAEAGQSGYSRNGAVLEVKQALYRGERATEADYEACHAQEQGNTGHAAVEPEPGTEGVGTNPVEQAEPANDHIYVVTSFVRAATTDLNLTLALAVLAVLAVQYFGIRALGFGYFAKFINIPALDKLDKKPMGVMDFAVGLLDIISELSRVISFGFRLFGNLFAGQVLLFVIPFLAGALLPLAVYGFELFVGVIQAFVFGMLLLVFAAMATTGHGHEEEHE